MRARALLIETLVGIASAAVAAGAFCWMVKYTVLKEADMIVIAAAVWLWVACKLLTWANRRNTHVFGIRSERKTHQHWKGQSNLSLTRCQTVAG